MIMQEKLEEILSNAKDWLTAAEIADKGKWRSASHVGLALKQMDGVEHRTSPIKKQGNGMPAKEYKLADKSFDSDVEAKIAATTAGSEVAELRQRIDHLEADRDKQRVLLSSKQEEIELLQDDIRRHVQRAEAAERNRDDIQQTARALFTDKTNLLAALDLATAEKDRLHAENLALKTLDESMPGFGAAHEAQKAKKQTQPRRPFSVTGLVGFHTGSQKVTLFLDRRLNARSVTLPADKLAQLAEMAGAA